MLHDELKKEVLKLMAQAGKEVPFKVLLSRLVDSSHEGETEIKAAIWSLLADHDLALTSDLQLCVDK